MDPLPFDFHYQQHFVNHLLRDSVFIRNVGDDCTPELFQDETLKRVAKLALDFFVDSGSAPATLAFRVLDSWRDKGLVADSVHKTVSALMDDLFALPLQNRSFLLAEYDGFLRTQRTKSVMEPFLNYVKRGEHDKAEQLMKELFLYRPKKSEDLGGILTTDPVERIIRRKQEDTETLWLLMPEVDSRIGGSKRGELCIWQSQRSSAGKSAALQFIARSAAFQGKKVLIYTLEMGRESYEDRLDMCVAGLSKQGLMDRDRIQKALLEMVSHGGNIWIKHFPMYLTTVSDLRRHCDLVRNVHGFHPDVVLVDYADLLISETPSIRGDLHASGAEVYGHLTGWLQEDDLFGWSAMQSGRGAMEATRADQQHTAGSIAKAQIAHLVLSINRTNEEEEEGLTQIFVVKNRNERARYNIQIHTDFTKMAFWVRS